VKTLRFIFAMASAAVLCALPSSARACAVCMGASDSNVAPAVNAAIFLMLGCVALMLTSIVFFIFYLARRAKNSADDHEEIARIMQGAAEGLG
jgi:hypothetical protein